MTPPRNGTHAHVLDVTEVVPGRVTLTPPSAPAGVTDAPPAYDPEGAGSDTDGVSLHKPGDTAGDTSKRRAPEGLPEPGRREVLPPWAKDPKATAVWAVSFAWHWLKFHALHVPLDLAKAAGWTPRGAGRAIVALHGWVTDKDAAPLRQAAVDGRLFAEHRDLDRRRKEAFKARAPVAALAVAGVPVFVYAGLRAGGAVTVATVLAVVLVGGWYGRPAGEPLFEPAVITAPKARRLTMDMVTAALVAAGLGPADVLQFFVQPHRRDGGWEFTVDLPPGKVFAGALAKRDAIAGALDVKGVQLVLTEDDESQRRVHFWLAPGDPYVGEPIPHPLLRARSWSVWKGAPLGMNARRKRITVPLLFTGVLIGSLPRVGKTVLVRSLMIPWLMDPGARVIAIDGKGGNDMKPAERLAYRYISGVTPAAVQLVVQTLQELLDDCDRRNAVINGLPIDDCPDGRLTPELAANKTLDMKPTAVFVDEVHRYLEHAVYGTEVGHLLKELAKVAPSVGISLVLSTQRPATKTMDDGLRGSLGTRIALRTATKTVSKMILGDAAPGYDASTFGKRHKGVFIVVGADDGELAEEPPQIGRGFHVTVKAFDELCRRLHADREANGLLEGMAAGEQPVLSAEFQLLDDLDAAFGPGDDKLWHTEIIERINAAHPERAGAWTEETLGRACTNVGLRVRQINRRGTNKRGVWRSDLLDLLAERAERIRLATVDTDAADTQAVADDAPDPSTPA